MKVSLVFKLLTEAEVKDLDRIERCQAGHEIPCNIPGPCLLQLNRHSRLDANITKARRDECVHESCYYLMERNNVYGK
jgi:hypothetical protein